MQKIAVYFVILLSGTMGFAAQDEYLSKASKMKSRGQSTLDEAIKKEESVGQPVSKDVIEGFNHLIKNTPPGMQRALLLVNRSRASTIHVRQSLLAGKRLELNAQEKVILQQALQDAMEVLKTNGISRETREKALKALGFAQSYSGQMDRARDTFALYLQENPKSKDAGWAALLVAEEFFSGGQFDRAAHYYRTFYGQMSPSEKELAYYKLAWCLINAKQNAAAEELFRRVILQAKSSQGLAKDATRDLAFLVAHHPSVDDAFKAAESLFGANQGGQLEFLNFVRASLEGQNNYTEHTRLVEKLITLEKDPEKQYHLLLANLRVSSREFASKGHLKALDRLIFHMRSAKIDPKNKAFTDTSSLLEAETSKILKAWIDTFSGKTKTPEAIKKEEIPTALEHVFAFFYEYFPNSKLRKPLLEIRLDMCVEVKDWKCLDWISDRIAIDGVDNMNLLERAGVIQLEALEKLGNKEKLADKTKRLYYWKRPFTAHLGVSKRYYNQLLEKKIYPEAIKVMDSIYLAEKSEDAYYRLQDTRFKAGLFAELLADKRMEPSSRLQTLRREATLNSAMNEKGKGDSSAYKNSLYQFLGMNPDPAKALIVRVELFELLMTQKAYAELLRAFLALKESDRFVPELDSVRTRYWRLLLSGGAFENAGQLSKTPMERVMVGLCKGLPLTGLQASFSSLKQEEKEYFLNILALTRPKEVIAFFQSLKAPPSLNEKAITHLALRMEEGVWVVQRTPLSTALLGTGYTFRILPGVVLGSEKLAGQVQLPKKGSAGAQFNKQLTQAIASNSKIRTALPKELQGKAAEDQIRAITKAIELELGIANAIRSAPVPLKLSAAQIQDYQKGIQEACQEFEHQAEEYKKLISGIEAAQLQKKKQESEGVLEPLNATNLAQWPWPNVLAKRPDLALAKDLAGKKNLAAALVLLDFIQTEAKLEPEDYRGLRTGFILIGSPYAATLPLRKYLMEELKSNSQEAWLEVWKGLVSKGQVAK